MGLHGLKNHGIHHHLGEDFWFTFSKHLKIKQMQVVEIFWKKSTTKKKPPQAHWGFSPTFSVAARPCIPGPLRPCCDVIDHKWMLDWQGASLAFVGLQSWEVELRPGKLTLNVAWMKTSPYLSIILVV